MQENNEHSGLHDIRELARSAKRRIDRKNQAETNAEHALRASASALDLIALPEIDSFEPTAKPKRRLGRGTASPIAAKATPVIAKPAAAIEAPLKTAAAPSVHIPQSTELHGFAPEVTGAQSPSGKRKWALGAFLLVAMSAGAAAFLFAGNKKEQSTVAKPVAAQPVASQPVVAKKIEAKKAPAVVIEQPVKVELETAEREVAEPVATPAEKVEVATKPEPKVEKPAAKKVEIDKASVKKPEPKKVVAKVEDKKPEVKKEIAAKKQEIKKEVSKPKPASDDISALLDEATAGGDIAGPKKVKKEAAKPSKTKITMTDVRKHVGGISGKVNGCYARYKQSGTAKIRFTVAPSGKVTKAYAKGAFKGTETGKCASHHVKKVKFPAFAGRPQSFTYPFLLQ